MCTHAFQKIPTFMSWTGECQQQKSTQYAPSTKTEYDYLNGWFKKQKTKNKQTNKQTNKKKTNKNGHICKNLTGNERQGHSWGTQKKLVGCLLALTSQQQASVSQGRICTDNFTCCHTEIQVADPTFYLTQSQYTDTGPTSPSADPIMPGAWQGSHWSANV